MCTVASLGFDLPLLLSALQPNASFIQMLHDPQHQFVKKKQINVEDTWPLWAHAINHLYFPCVIL